MGRITLTFDNGPEPEMTSLVLDVLRKQAVQATFFVIGRNLERPGARAVVERARAEGHWIGNHSFTHRISLGNAPTDSFFDDEVSRTFDALVPDRGRADERGFWNALRPTLGASRLSAAGAGHDRLRDGSRLRAGGLERI